MHVSVQFAIAAVLSVVGIAAATAGEGSDIGPPPPYGTYANERGRPAPGVYGRPAPYGSPDARAGRTTREPRSRR